MLSEGTSSDSTQFRVLIQFDKLSLFIPPSSIIDSCDLAITFTNWNLYSSSNVQACYITKRWDISNNQLYQFQLLKIYFFKITYLFLVTLVQVGLIVDTSLFLGRLLEAGLIAIRATIL
jgi:hypothetical protein